MNNKAKKELLNKLIASLNKDNWVREHCTVELPGKDGMSRVIIWTSNGFAFCDLYPNKIGFNLFQRWKLYRAVQAFWVRRVQERLDLH